MTSFHAPIFEMFAKIVLQAWKAREVAFKNLNKSLSIPGIVSLIQQYFIAQKVQKGHEFSAGYAVDDPNTSSVSTPVPMAVDSKDLSYGTKQDAGDVGEGIGLGSLDLDMNLVDWSTMDWDSSEISGWS